MGCTRMARHGVLGLGGCLCLILMLFAAKKPRRDVRGGGFSPPLLTLSSTLPTTATTSASYVFLHIGKTGGTTVDSALSSADLSYVGHRHFDWSWIALHCPRHRVLLVLRHPVSRAVSQFYFSRTLSWTQGMSIRQQTLRDYFNDYQGMLATRGVWQDGEAGASWLAGTHIGNWVLKDASLSIDAREQFEQNTRAMCTRVEDRLRSAYWVGFTETLDSDLGRLGLMLGRPLRVGKHNVNRHPTEVAPDVVLKIAALTTLDHWLYDNAKSLASNPNHVFSACPLQHLCRSTRFTLNCTEASPFGQVFYKFVM